LLVINQANKEWSCLDEKMMMYHQELHKLENNFNGLEYHRVLHRWNEVANELAKIGLNRATVPPVVFMQELHEPSISKTLFKAIKDAESVEGVAPSNDNEPESPNVMIVRLNWCTPFMMYLKTGDLHEDKDERERLRRWAGHYTLVGEELFRQSANGVLMRCIPTEEGCYILQDIHSGVCDN
jgi:hypothetical protein